MKALTKRQLLLALNGVALTVDVLKADNPGQFPGAKELDVFEIGGEEWKKEYAKNPYITFYELNEVMNILWLLYTGDYNELASLPPTAIQ